MATTPEGKVKDKIKRVLKKYGAYYCMPNAGPFGKSGVPDFICCYKGAFLAIEAKADGGEVSELQQQQLDKIAAAQGWALVIEGAQGVELLDRFLEGTKLYASP